MHDEAGFAAVHRSFEALLHAFGDDAAAEVEISVQNLAVAAILQSTYSFASFLLADGDGAAVIVGLVDDVVALPVAGDGVNADVDVALEADVASPSAGRGSGPFATPGGARGPFERLPAVLVQRLAFGLVATASTLTFEHDWLEAGVVTFELGRLLVMILAEVFSVVNLDLTSARVFDRLDRRALSRL